MLPISQPNTNSSSNISRGQNRAQYGQALDWWTQVKGKEVKIGDVLKVQDFQTVSNLL